jgi:hypothetical protein
MPEAGTRSKSISRQWRARPRGRLRSDARGDQSGDPSCCCAGERRRTDMVDLVAGRRVDRFPESGERCDHQTIAPLKHNKAVRYVRLRPLSDEKEGGLAQPGNVGHANLCRTSRRLSAKGCKPGQRVRVDRDNTDIRGWAENHPAGRSSHCDMGFCTDDARDLAVGNKSTGMGGRCFGARRAGNDQGA